MACVTSSNLETKLILKKNVFESEPVKRLFSQPNIEIRAIASDHKVDRNKHVKPVAVEPKINGLKSRFFLSNHPELSIHIVPSKNEKTVEEQKNVDYTLPSKKNGKSEVELVPIEHRLKDCGHYLTEYCEDVMCDVEIHHFEDDDGSCPLVAFDLDDDELCGPVEKHCADVNCDALSIDHNRCRTAKIILNRFDENDICDICEMKFQNLNERLNHKNCKRKTAYQHNDMTAAELLRLKMREREIQIIEESKIKKTREYLDPVTGYNKTIRALRKNDEIIVIPKKTPMRIMSQKRNIHGMNSFNDSFKYLQNRLQVSNTSTNYLENICPPPKQIKLADHLNGAVVNIRKSPKNVSNNIDYPSSLNKTNSTVNGTSKVTMDNNHPQLISSLQKCGSQIPRAKDKVSCSPISLKQSPHPGDQSLPELPTDLEGPLSTPVKIVPISELKSEPSLLHKVQGVPKYCIVPDANVLNPLHLDLSPDGKRKISPIKIKKIHPSYSSNKLLDIQKKYKQVYPKSSCKKIVPGYHTMPPPLLTPSHIVALKNNVISTKSKKSKKRSRPRKKLIKKGKFCCTHCPKRFTSSDYCKLHIAKHENNLDFFCRICEKAQLSRNDLKKHMEIEHKIGEVRCEMCNHVSPSIDDLLNHMKNPGSDIYLKCSECINTFKTCSTLDIHMQKTHGFVICSLCKRQVAKCIIIRHLTLEHSFSKTKAEADFEKYCSTPTNDEICSMNEKTEIELKAEPVTSWDAPVAKKIDSNCLARNRTSRRGSKSSQNFMCVICWRRFDNEKQYEIHLASNPKKHTSCYKCEKKFHRKSDCTEHIKTCNRNADLQPVIMDSSYKVCAVIPKTNKIILTKAIKKEENFSNLRNDAARKISSEEDNLSGGIGTNISDAANKKSLDIESEDSCTKKIDIENSNAPESNILRINTSLKNEFSKNLGHNEIRNHDNINSIKESTNINLKNQKIINVFESRLESIDEIAIITKKQENSGEKTENNSEKIENVKNSITSDGKNSISEQICSKRVMEMSSDIDTETTNKTCDNLSDDENSDTVCIEEKQICSKETTEIPNEKALKTTIKTSDNSVDFFEKHQQVLQNSENELSEINTQIQNNSEIEPICIPSSSSSIKPFVQFEAVDTENNVIDNTEIQIEGLEETVLPVGPSILVNSDIIQVKSTLAKADPDSNHTNYFNNEKIIKKQEIQNDQMANMEEIANVNDQESNEFQTSVESDELLALDLVPNKVMHLEVDLKLEKESISKFEGIEQICPIIIEGKKVESVSVLPFVEEINHTETVSAIVLERQIDSKQLPESSVSRDLNSLIGNESQNLLEDECKYSKGSNNDPNVDTLSHSLENNTNIDSCGTQNHTQHSKVKNVEKISEKLPEKLNLTEIQKTELKDSVPNKDTSSQNNEELFEKCKVRLPKSFDNITESRNSKNIDNNIEKPSESLEKTGAKIPISKSLIRLSNKKSTQVRLQSSCVENTKNKIPLEDCKKNNKLKKPSNTHKEKCYVLREVKLKNVYVSLEPLNFNKLNLCNKIPDREKVTTDTEACNHKPDCINMDSLKFHDYINGNNVLDSKKTANLIDINKEETSSEACGNKSIVLSINQDHNYQSIQ